MLFKIKFVKVYDKHNFSLIKTILIKKKKHLINLKVFLVLALRESLASAKSQFGHVRVHDCVFSTNIYRKVNFN